MDPIGRLSLRARLQAEEHPAVRRVLVASWVAVSGGALLGITLTMGDAQTVRAQPSVVIGVVRDTAGIESPPVV